MKVQSNLFGRNEENGLDRRDLVQKVWEKIWGQVMAQEFRNTYVQIICLQA